MGALTDHTPKPLLELAGLPLIEYHVRALASAGVCDLVINLAWHGEQIVKHLGDGSRFGVHIQYSHEQDGALETAGGIAHALPLLGDAPFMVVNGDVWSDFPLQVLAADAQALTGSAQAHVIMVPNPSHNPNGDFSFSPSGGSRHGWLVDTPVDGASGTGEPHDLFRATFSGLGVYRPALFHHIHGRAALGPLLKEWIGKQQVSAEFFQGHWWDVGTPERLVLVESFLTGSSSVALDRH